MHDIAYIVIHDEHIHYITLRYIAYQYTTLHTLHTNSHTTFTTSHHIESHHISALHQAPLAPEHRPGIVWHWGHVVYSRDPVESTMSKSVADFQIPRPTCRVYICLPVSQKIASIDIHCHPSVSPSISAKNRCALPALRFLSKPSAFKSC